MGSLDNNYNVPIAAIEWQIDSILELNREWQNINHDRLSFDYVPNYGNKCFSRK